VHIDRWDGKSFTLGAWSGETLRQLKVKISGETDIPPDDQRLYFGEELLTDSTRRLASYKIDKPAVRLKLRLRFPGKRLQVCLVCVDCVAETERNPLSILQIDVAMPGGWTFNIGVWSGETVGQLKGKICDETGCPTVDYLNLMCDERRLEDDGRRLASYDIKDNSLVRVVLRMRLLGGGGDSAPEAGATRKSGRKAKVRIAEGWSGVFGGWVHAAHAH